MQSLWMERLKRGYERAQQRHTLSPATSPTLPLSILFAPQVGRLLLIGGVNAVARILIVLPLEEALRRDCNVTPYSSLHYIFLIYTLFSFSSLSFSYSYNLLYKDTCGQKQTNKRKALSLHVFNQHHTRHFLTRNKTTGLK